MKKITFLSIFTFFSIVSFAQVELTGYTGWQFGSKTNYYQGSLRIRAAQDYGGMLAIEVRPDLQVELGYMYSSTTADLERYGLPNIDLGDVNIHYYQIGGTAPKAVSNNVDAFGSFTLGATHYAVQENSFEDPSDGQHYNLEDYTSFSITLGGGAKIWIGDSKKVGIKIQGRFLMPITWGGLTIGCGGGGCGTGVTVGSSLFSGDILGGIVLRLGE